MRTSLKIKLLEEAGFKQDGMMWRGMKIYKRGELDAVKDRDIILIGKGPFKIDFDIFFVYLGLKEEALDELDQMGLVDVRKKLSKILDNAGIKMSKRAF